MNLNMPFTQANADIVTGSVMNKYSAACENSPIGPAGNRIRADGVAFYRGRDVAVKCTHNTLVVSFGGSWKLFF
jgi:hypothetical protein